MKEWIYVLISSEVISKNTNEFDVRLVCRKCDDLVGIISSRRFATLEKYLLKVLVTFSGVAKI